MKTLEQQYESLCNKYMVAFSIKHGYEFSYWVSDDVGTIACFIDEYYFGFDDIRHDIDNEIKKGFIFEWVDDTVAHHLKSKRLDGRDINFKNYIAGLRYKDLAISNNVPPQPHSQHQ